MNNIINPYTSSRTHVQEHGTSKNEAEEELNPSESNKIDSSKLPGNGTDIPTNKKEHLDDVGALQAQNTSKVQEPEGPSASSFINALEGVIERKEEVSLQADNRVANPTLPGLNADEQQMIYRYFPESPNLELRLYKQDMSTNKVIPGSVGSRVDLRG